MSAGGDPGRMHALIGAGMDAVMDEMNEALAVSGPNNFPG